MNRIVLTIVGAVIGTIIGVILAAYIRYFVGMVVSLTTFGILGVDNESLPSLFAWIFVWIFVGIGVLAAAIGSGKRSYITKEYNAKGTCVARVLRTEMES